MGFGRQQRFWIFEEARGLFEVYGVSWDFRFGFCNFQYFFDFLKEIRFLWDFEFCKVGFRFVVFTAFFGFQCLVWFCGYGQRRLYWLVSVLIWRCQIRESFCLLEVQKVFSFFFYLVRLFVKIFVLGIKGLFLCLFQNLYLNCKSL